MKNGTQGMERMKQARARLMISQPFFGSASIALKFIEDPRIPTACTDGRVLRFNPGYTDPLPIEIVESLICHEVLHCVMLHPLRIQERDHRLSNMAMDYVVNGQMKRARLTLREGWLHAPDLSAPDKSFEVVYSILRAKAQEKAQQKSQGGQGAPQEQEEPQQGQGDPQEGEEDPQEGQSSGTPEEGQEDPGEEYQPGPGEVEPATGEDGGTPSESERCQLEGEWKITAARALQAAQACGKVPDGMERLVQDMQIKKRDLEDVLRDFVQKTRCGDYTWNRPSKKHLIHDIYMPSVQGDAIPSICMVMDTSGSIGDEQVAYFQAKINSVLSEFETQIRVLYVDTRCHDGGEFDSSDLPIKLKPKGGGGTDFQPAFKWLEKNGEEPTCLIYYTDGYCDSFPEDPGFPVLWALYGQERTVPFGEVVNIDPQ